MKAAGDNRYGHRDASMILLAFRHGLRASELCSFRWEQVDLTHGRLHVTRAKNGIDSVHPLTGSELRALRRLQREQEQPGRYVFMSERGAPMSAVGFRRMITRLGAASKMPFQIHPQMLRHACGFKLANQGVDTRALQHTPSATPNFHPTGSATSGEISVRWQASPVAPIAQLAPARYRRRGHRPRL
jgi:integrase